MAMKKAGIGEALELAKPERVALVIGADRAGKPNLMPATWFMRVSGAPPMLAVSLRKERHTYGLVMSRKEFVIALPAEGMEKVIEVAGSTSGRDMDKFAALGLKSLPADSVGVPLLDGAVANFECRVVSTHEAGDHVIVVGEVVAAHLGESRRVIIHTGGLRYIAFEI
jgi:flavin reductase (DIM6/NTAB) family NADH-FMN oxidoreductase RutF